MRYRTIAGTDLSVSEIGFGVWTLTAGWWGDHSDEDAASMLRDATDLGINFIDTADTYGQGRGERMIATAFPGAERDKIVLSTKFGYDWESVDRSAKNHQPAQHCFEPDFVERALHNSLDRMGTDHIDLWQLHNVRMEHLQRDDLWTLIDRVRTEGKVRSVGVALGPAIGWLDEGVYAMEHLPIQVVHMIYNALELDPGRTLIETARRTNKSLLTRVPHSSGMLEGKYTLDTTFAADDHRKHRPRAWLVNGLKKIEQLDFLTASGERTLGQAALRYVLREPEVVSALPNIYDRDQLAEFAAASDVPDVSDDEAARIETLFTANYGLAVEREAGLATR
ncbi:MAG: aldo/keto reductase [Chloroflexi bacterium]|nr:aldo/keto reductase [Chloroflexota bacterium]MDA1147276.1 aldo/keto reductase [Chloroflexota bacterium]